MLTIKNKIILATALLSTTIAIFVILYGQRTFSALTFENALETQVSYLMSVDAHLETAVDSLIYPTEVLSQLVSTTAQLADPPLSETDFTLWQATLTPYVMDQYALVSPHQSLTLYALDAQGHLADTSLIFKDSNQNGFLDAPVAEPANLDALSVARLTAAADSKPIWLPSFKQSRQSISEQLYWRIALPVPNAGDRQKPNVFFVLQGPYSLLTKHIPKHPSEFSPALALVDPEGEYLAQTELFPFETNAMLAAIQFEPKLDSGSAQEYDYGEQTTPDNHRYTLLRKPLSTGWYLIYTFPKSKLLESGKQVNQFAWLIACIFVLVTTVIVMRIADYLDAPLNELIRYLEQDSLAPGHSALSEDLLTRHDEIGILGRAFEALGTELGLRRTQLLEVQHILESQVAERNIALSQTNQLLTESIERLNAQEEALQAIHQRLLKNLQSIEATQKQLIQNEKSSSMKFLAAGVAHELNTPIGNAITLASFLAQEETALLALVSEYRPEQHEAIVSCIAVFDNAINQLIHNLAHANDIVALLEAMVPDTTALQVEHIHLSEFLTLRMTQMLALADIPVQLNIQCDPELWISTDPNQLSMLLMPLVQNSLDHGFKFRRSGTITLTVKAEDNMLTLIFEDDGNGIPAMHRPHLLTPFFTTHLGRHKGLGLNLAYNIASFYFKGYIEIVDTGLPGTRIDCHLHL